MMYLKGLRAMKEKTTKKMFRLPAIILAVVACVAGASGFLVKNAIADDTLPTVDPYNGETILTLEEKNMQTPVLSNIMENGGKLTILEIVPEKMQSMFQSITVGADVYKNLARDIADGFTNPVNLHDIIFDGSKWERYLANKYNDECMSYIVQGGDWYQDLTTGSWKQNELSIPNYFLEALFNGEHPDPISYAYFSDNMEVIIVTPEELNTYTDELFAAKNIDYIYVGNPYTSGQAMQWTVKFNYYIEKGTFDDYNQNNYYGSDATSYASHDLDRDTMVNLLTKVYQGNEDTKRTYHADGESAYSPISAFISTSGWINDTGNNTNMVNFCRLLMFSTDEKMDYDETVYDTLPEGGVPRTDYFRSEYKTSTYNTDADPEYYFGYSFLNDARDNMTFHYSDKIGTVYTYYENFIRMLATDPNNAASSTYGFWFQNKDLTGDTNTDNENNVKNGTFVFYDNAYALAGQSSALIGDYLGLNAINNNQHVFNYVTIVVSDRPEWTFYGLTKCGAADIGDTNAKTAMAREISSENDGTPKSSFSLVDSLRYSLGLGLGQKSGVRVLEIEPSNSFSLDELDEIKEFAATYLHIPGTSAWSTIDAASKYVEVTCMSSSELNTVNIDLISNFDMIIIGDENGLVNSSGKLFASDYLYSTGGTTTAGLPSGNYGSGDAHTVKYSGNDFTQKSVDRILEFAQTGLPIVLGNNVINKTCIQGDTKAMTLVDSLIAYNSERVAEGKAETVIAQASMSRMTSLLRNRYLQEGDISINFSNDTSYVNNYCSSDGVYDATQMYDADGLVQVGIDTTDSSKNVRFTATSSGIPNATAKVTLYFDRDGNGEFSDDLSDYEIMRTVNVTFGEDGEATAVLDFTMDRGVNAYYQFRVQVEGGGLSSNGYEKVCSDGFIWFKGDSKTIKVLQICHDDGSGRASTTLLLSNKMVYADGSEAIMTDSNYTTYVGTTNTKEHDPLNNSTNGQQAYIYKTMKSFQSMVTKSSERINYNIEIEVMTDAEYQKAVYNYYRTVGNIYDAADYSTNYLANKGYSMVIIGFGDNNMRLYNSYGGYGGDESHAVEVIADFAKAGNALLMSHDVICYRDEYYDIRDHLATISGQNVSIEYDGLSQRFAWTGSKHTTSSYFNDYFDDFTDFTILLKGYTKYTSGNYTANSTNGYNLPDLTYGDGGVTTTADQMNGGQVTQFPYNMAKLSNGTASVASSTTQIYPYSTADATTAIPVTVTHSQWFQLDLERATVWYTLGSSLYNGGYSSSNYYGNYYGDTAGNGTNNYYIYSLDNITYTGAGHAVIADGPELNLFVNTIIKAALASNNTPRIAICDKSGTELIMSGDNQYTVTVIDDGDTSETIDIYFRATDIDYGIAEEEFDFSSIYVEGLMTSEMVTANYYLSNNNDDKKSSVNGYVDAGCTQYNKSGAADDVMYNLASTSEVQKISIPKTSEMYTNAFPEGSTNGYLDIYFRAADEYGATGITKVRLQVVRLNDLD